MSLPIRRLGRCTAQSKWETEMENQFVCWRLVEQPRRKQVPTGSTVSSDTNKPVVNNNYSIDLNQYCQTNKIMWFKDTFDWDLLFVLVIGLGRSNRQPRSSQRLVGLNEAVFIGKRVLSSCRKFRIGSGASCFISRLSTKYNSTLPFVCVCVCKISAISKIDFESYWVYRWEWRDRWKN